jgi:diguanylate cyclase (GGDEF)-like protein
MPRFWFQKTPRLRAILIVPFLLQIVAAVGLTGWLSLRNGQKAVNDLSERLMIEVSDRIDQHLDQYLATPIQVTQANLDAIELKLLNLDNIDTVKRHFSKQLNLYPGIGYLAYTSIQGTYVGAGRWLEGQGITFDEMSPATGNIFHSYETDQRGNQGKFLLDDTIYNPQEASWYQQTLKLKRMNWAPIEPEPGEMSYISASVNAPVYDRQQQLRGVISTDLPLAAVSDFLRSLKVGSSGQVFVMEPDGLLVASSGDEKPFKVLSQQEITRLSVLQSQKPAIRAAASYLQQTFGQFREIHQAKSFRFSQSGQSQFLRVTPWKDAVGLNWLVVVVVPESDFMGQINANTQTTILLCVGALIIAAGLGFYTSRWVTKPILQLSNASRSITLGQLDQEVTVPNIKELKVLATSFNTMATQLRDSFAQLSYHAHHDNLTGLFNRFAFRHLLQEQIAQHQSTDAPLPTAINHTFFAVLFLDLDYFKLVNDSLGHLAGDQLLIQVAERLKTCIRGSDILGRFGGDEFVILLNPLEHMQDAVRVAQRITEELHKPFYLGDSEVYIGTSIGIVPSTLAEQNPDSLLRNADSALYQAKAKGRGVYEIFDTEMYTNVIKRVQLEHDLRQAIDRSELMLYYQPIIDIQTHQVTGYEALLRWFHPTVGMISPTDFIPIAEETGLIVKLGWWVLRQACQQMQDWHQTCPELADCTISVNLSSKQFLQVDLLPQIQGILAETQLPAQYLKLEITESVLMTYHETTLKKMQDLDALGIQLSIDDFGTGYSSLSYLHRFPIHTLKIDRSFITQLEQSSEQLAITRVIIQMAHQLGMDVVAEGVERPMQFTLLKALGCEAAQGFLFSRPVAHPEIPQVTMMMKMLIQGMEFVTAVPLA